MDAARFGWRNSTAAAILARHPELPAGLDSIVLVETEGGRERRASRRAGHAVCPFVPGRT